MSDVPSATVVQDGKLGGDVPKGEAGHGNVVSGNATLAIGSLGYGEVRNIGTDAGIDVCFNSIAVRSNVETIANLQSIPLVARKMIVRQYIAGALEDGHSILCVAE